MVESKYDEIIKEGEKKTNLRHTHAHSFFRRKIKEPNEHMDMLAS